MATGYTPDWWPLLTAIEHVKRLSGAANHSAADALMAPLREGKIRSRYRGLAGRGGAVAPEHWYLATIDGDGVVDFGDDPRFPRLGQHPLGPPRHQVEVWRAHVLRYWPEAAIQLEPVTAVPLPADAAPREGKSNRKPTMTAAAREYIAHIYPCGIPAGKTDKIIAAEYTYSHDGLPMKERSVRRARTGK